MSPIRLFLTLGLCCLLALVALPAGAQEAPVALTVQAPATLSPGQEAVVEVVAVVAAGLHVNAHQPDDPSLIPTVLRLEAGPGLEVGPVAYPAPSQHQVEFLPQPIQVYGGKVSFRVPVKALAVGAQPLKAVLEFQACNDQMCMMPEAAEATAQVVVKK